METQAIGGEDFGIHAQVLGGLAGELGVAEPVLDQAEREGHRAVLGVVDEELIAGHGEIIAEYLCYKCLVSTHRLWEQEERVDRKGTE
jgi:hypothetical protein